MSTAPTPLRDEFDDFMDEAAAICNGTWYNGKVVGVTHPNPDRSDRQAILRTLSPCDLLQLEPEPDNKYDENAIKVLTPGGRQIGYLDGRLAGELTRKMRKGIVARCYFRALRESKGVAGASFGLLEYATD